METKVVQNQQVKI